MRSEVEREHQARQFGSLLILSEWSTSRCRECASAHVQGDDAAEALHRQRDLTAARRCATREPGQTTLHYDRLPSGVAPREHERDLTRVPWPHHGQRSTAPFARKIRPDQCVSRIESPTRTASGPSAAPRSASRPPAARPVACASLLGERGGTRRNLQDSLLACNGRPH